MSALEVQDSFELAAGGEHASGLSNPKEQCPIDKSLLWTYQSLETSQSPKLKHLSSRCSVDKDPPSMLSVNNSMSTNLNTQKLMADVERRQIDKLMKMLDEKEIEMCNESEDFSAPILDYLTALQHSIYALFLKNRNSKVQTEDQKVLQKAPHLLYSKSLIRFA